MSASSRPSSSTDVVDEPLLRNIGAENQAAIPGAEMRLNSCGDAFGYGFRARGNVRPESDLDLQVTVPEAWLASHSRLEETDALGLPMPWLTRAAQRRSASCSRASSGIPPHPSPSERTASLSRSISRSTANLSSSDTIATLASTREAPKAISVWYCL